MKPITHEKVREILASNQRRLASHGREGNMADFLGVLVHDFDFSSQNLESVDFNRSTFLRCQFRGADLTACSIQSDFIDCDFTGAILLKAEITSSDFRGSCFEFAQLTRCYIDKSNLDGVSFRKSQLVGAIIETSNVHGADFTDSFQIDFTFASNVGEPVGVAPLEWDGGEIPNTFRPA